jgi:hypothetical protein
MTSWIPRAGVAVLLLVSLGSPGGADTTAARFSVKGDTAVAEFQTINPTNTCIHYFVSVVAADLMQRTSPGGPTPNVGTVLVATLQDDCLGVTLFVGSGQAAQQSFQVAHNLSTATLTTTVSLLDVITGLSYTFDVDLTWTALGPPAPHHDTETFQDKEAGILIQTQLRGTQVDAQATGTVVGLGQNFTPQPSSSAELLAQNDGTVVIQMTH